MVQALPSGSEALQVETDAGLAFAKLPGGKEGPHILACELVGTRLVALLGLPVLDWVLNCVRDETAFGLFPEFVSAIQRADAVAAAGAPAGISNDAIRKIVTTIPPDWEVERPIQAAMEDFLCQRRDRLAKIFVARLFPQDELDLR